MKPTTKSGERMTLEKHIGGNTVKGASGDKLVAARVALNLLTASHERTVCLQEIAAEMAQPSKPADPDPTAEELAAAAKEREDVIAKLVKLNITYKANSKTETLKLKLAEAQAGN